MRWRFIVSHQEILHCLKGIAWHNSALVANFTLETQWMSFVLLTAPNIQATFCHTVSAKSDVPLSHNNQSQFQPLLAKCKIAYSAPGISSHLALCQEQPAGLLCVCKHPLSLSAALHLPSLSVSPINTTLLSVSISPSSSNPVFTLFWSVPFWSFPQPSSSSSLQFNLLALLHLFFSCLPSRRTAAFFFLFFIYCCFSILFSCHDSCSPFCFLFLVLSFVLIPPNSVLQFHPYLSPPAFRSYSLNV